MTHSSKIVLKSSLNESVHGYWRGCAGANPMPARRDIDPVIDLGSLVENLILIDVERDPLRFRFRLVGTVVVELVGADMTGMYLDEAVETEEQIALIQTDCEAIVNLGQAMVSQVRFPFGNARGNIDYECLLMPLSDDAKNVNMILGVSAPVDSGVRPAPAKASLIRRSGSRMPWSGSAAAGGPALEDRAR
ncbi:MAG: PAS domain-containing protein [Alphaproteobacteria bacterium]